ncbi:MAG TPA: substrate-binding domain-containing protein [Conexibacter sp.]
MRQPRRRLGSLLALCAAALIVVVMTACGSSGTSGASAGSSTTAAADASGTADTTSSSGSDTTASSSGDTVVNGNACGEVPIQKPADDDNILPTLDREVQDKFNGYPGPVRPSPWARFAGKRPPYKIGLVGLAANSAFNVNLYRQIQVLFDQAKAQGLVTGTLQKAIDADQATETPAQQIAGYQSMVRDGVDGVLMLPLAGDAIAPAITKAGEAGVPTVVMGNTNPSPYAAVVNSPNIAAGTAKTLGILRQGNVLIVRGIPGVPAETYGYNQIQAAIRACSGVKVIGEINGNWNNATAKTAMLQYLASHPQRIDAVLQNGIMAQGIIQAFEQAGRPVPPVTMVGAQAGELSWFKDHARDGYKTAGSAYNGKQQADAAWRVLLRILDGKGLKVTDIPLNPALVTADNVAQFVPPGATLNTVDDPLGDVQSYAPDDYLDKVFDRPGNVEPAS